MTVVLPGDYGKPRPAVVVQTNAGHELPSLVVCPLTRNLGENTPYFRLRIEPHDENGLRERSYVMVDKVMAVPRRRIGGTIGALDAASMAELDDLLAILLGLV